MVRLERHPPAHPRGLRAGAGRRIPAQYPSLTDRTCSMTPYRTCRLSIADGVATATLARPQTHNAFDDVLIAELTSVLVALDADETVRAVVLTGDGGTFSAGADLGW